MQPLNDDMDDLFRRASEEYPLNTQGADWDKVMQKLDHEENELTGEYKRKRDFRSLWLLLLLPIGFICGRYVGHNGKHKTTAVNEISTASAPSVNNTSGIAETQKQAAEVKGTNAGVEGGSGEKLEEHKGSKASTSSGEIRGSKTASRSDNSTLISNNKQFAKVAKPGTNADALLAKDVALKEGKFYSDNGAGLSSFSEPTDQTNNNANATGNLPAQVTTKSEHDETSMAKDAAAEKGTDKQSVVNADKAEKEPTEKSKIQKPAIRHNLSYSIVFGPDVSTVKSQRASTVGYSIGVLLRYQLLGKLSVEGGVLWARKNYYTEGKYLDTSNLKLPPWSKVKTADGYCNMFEIPINLKYDLITKKNNSLFISAGVSSYLMNHEAYDVSYQLYSQLYSKEYAYSNSSKNWFSIVNISAGYERSLGKKVTVGIAPYIKLPLGGIGNGKLPVTSKGVYLSLTKYIR